MSNVMTIIDIGFNGYQLFQRDFPELWENIQNYKQQAESSNSARMSLVVKTTSVASKTLTIVLSFASIITSKNLEQQKKIKALLSKTKFVNYLSTVLDSGLYSIQKGENPFKNTDFLLNISNVTAYVLEIRGTISQESVTVWERALRITQEAPKLYSLSANPHKRVIVWELAQDSFYLQVDYWFPLFQLSNIPLCLRDVKIINIAYSLIPQECKRNRVFRQFNCYLTKEPIRYPVIVLDNAGVPIQPIRCFERKNLVTYLCMSSIYPGTTQEIELSQVKEHIGIRRIIKAEIIRLNINLL